MIYEIRRRSRCILHEFLANYIREVFLGRYHMTLAGQIEMVTKSADAWSLVTPPDQMKALGRTRPLLQVLPSFAPSTS